MGTRGGPRPSLTEVCVDEEQDSHRAGDERLCPACLLMEPEGGHPLLWPPARFQEDRALWLPVGYRHGPQQLCLLLAFPQTWCFRILHQALMKTDF